LLPAAQELSLCGGRWANTNNELNNGGYEAFIYELMNYNLKGFNVRAVPQTKGLMSQKLHGINSAAKFWYEIIDSEYESIPSTYLGKHKDEYFIERHSMRSMYLEWCRVNGNRYPMGAPELGKKLAQLGLAAKNININPTAGKEDRKNVYVLPAKDKAKELFKTFLSGAARR
ncbi:MAG: hypothetical protein WCJ64_10650, partial [Rhodospirillaceae bacterium]